MKYPSDPRGGPENVINCRCTNAPFPKELDNDYSSCGVIEDVITVAQTVATVAAIEEILDDNTEENN